MLSVIIPSFKDPYLVKTIQSILDNFTGEFEVIAVLDGYWPDFKLIEDKRVRYVHLGKNVGMREAINTGVKLAKGEFIMRTDEHCMFAPGIDKILTDSCQDNWIITARRFFLDPVQWAVMDIPPVCYEKLVIQTAGGGKKFTGYPSPSPYNELLHETQAMQGSFWIMKKSWWDKLGELDSQTFGPHFQDSHEMVFKTWKLGGKLMIHNGTWYAHKHVSFERTHSYPRDKADEELNRSYNYWKDYYQEWKQSQS